MNNFLTELDVRYIDGKRWRVREEFTYRLADANGREFVRIPVGFETDFASMPLGIIFRSPGGKWDKPAVVHDYLYKFASLTASEGVTQYSRPVTRAEADRIFDAAMVVAGVHPLARLVIFWGVRLGGWWAWGQHRRAARNALRAA